MTYLLTGILCRCTQNIRIMYMWSIWARESYILYVCIDIYLDIFFYYIFCRSCNDNQLQVHIDDWDIKILKLVWISAIDEIAQGTNDVLNDYGFTSLIYVNMVYDGHIFSCIGEWWFLLNGFKLNDYNTNWKYSVIRY